MKKLLIFLFYCLISVSVIAQNPQGFNYQAVALNGTLPIGNTTLLVKVSILSDTSGFHASGGGDYIWEEQQSVKTNSSGVFNLVIGDAAATKMQGSADSFSEIDWSQDPLFIGTKIEYPSPNWKFMGTSRIWSVPYSMVSQATRGVASGSKLEVVSANDESSDALFEVRRKDGQVVFAVYNDAVNVFVPDQQAKKAKGGFAVGSYDASKGFSQRYLIVTPDSIRFYINDSISKGIVNKGGFAVGGFGDSMGPDKKYLSLFGARTTSDTISNGTQIMLGVGSRANGKSAISIGFKSVASEPYSVAMGMYSQARANFSTSIGYHSIAQNQYSTALGYYALAQGYDSYAIGSHAEANGTSSFAIGSFGLKEDNTVNEGRATWAQSFYGLAFGMGAQATALGAMALGVNTTASGAKSVGIGFGSTASSEFATALGYKASANGTKSIAIGAHYHVIYDKPVWEWSTTLGKWIITTISTEIDRQTVSDGEFSISIGNGNHSNNGGLSLGTNNDAMAFGSVAIGHSNVANGDFSFAAGFGNIADALKSFAFGESLVTKSTNSFVVGAFNKIEGTANEWFDKEPLFVVGNGHPGNRSNAFAVLKDGNIVLSENLAPNTSGVQLYYDPVDHLMKREVSSVRYKTDIEPLTDIGWLYNLNPVRFSYKSDPGKSLQYGLIAEEMDEINKNLVVYSNGEPESIDYNGLFAPIIKAVQDQKIMINDLQVINVSLSEENRELRMRLEKLEQVASAMADSEN
ncbi:MAG: tail fiber domain-containing protein [Bacteroidales bacterium]|jgi:hypothetical protein|nr:tail fiber domain-containing protein [Bacteroidales bacterium]